MKEKPYVDFLAREILDSTLVDILVHEGIHLAIDHYPRREFDQYKVTFTFKTIKEINLENQLLQDSGYADIYQKREAYQRSERYPYIAESVGLRENQIIRFTDNLRGFLGFYVGEAVMEARTSKAREKAKS